MTIEEARRLKAEAEEAILIILSDLIRETGLVIGGLDVTFYRSELMNGSSQTATVVKINAGL